MKIQLTPTKIIDGYQHATDDKGAHWHQFEEDIDCDICGQRTQSGYCLYEEQADQKVYAACMDCVEINEAPLLVIQPEAKPQTLNRRKDGKKSGMGFGYEAPTEGDTNVWLTPLELVESLGEFHLDPCSPLKRHWDTADKHLTIRDDGLKTEWGGADVRVWLNPPYGRESGDWMKKMAEHGNGIALIFARTETQYFDPIFDHASAFFFIRGRIKFYREDGTQGSCATAPSVLIAFDNEASNGYNAEMLSHFDWADGALFGPATPKRKVKATKQLLIP